MVRRGRTGSAKWRGIQEDERAPEAAEAQQPAATAPQPMESEPAPAMGRGAQAQKPGVRRLSLVTGATGRLGRKLVDALLANGERVRILHREELGETVPPRGWEAFRGDLSDRASLGRAVEGADVVYHLAALVERDASPADLLHVNYYGTKNLLDACASAGKPPKRFVFASSISVYGKRIARLPADESTPADPSDWYGKSKLLAEDAVKSYGKSFPATILRPAVIYGEGFDEAYLPLLALLEKRRMVLINGGRNFVPLIHARDVVRAMMLAADSGAAAGKAYVVAPRERRTQREIMEIACRFLGVPPPKYSVPLALASAALKLAAATGLAGRKGGLLEEHVLTLAADRYFDVSRAEQDFGFKAEVALEDGIREMVEYYNSRKGGTQ
ncbi:MAG: NAD(P)-dependent oxidoreductase [Candidatus ainarchaeum sp.]|nr:NAD(P)-dependent oxidoreductase [Candidatus ainarchaeum sp.]